MNLSEYYQSLKYRKISPRRKFVQRVARECDVVEVTVYRWISGDFYPDKLKRERVSQITQIPVDELFSHIKEKPTATE